MTRVCFKSMRVYTKSIISTYKVIWLYIILRIATLTNIVGCSIVFTTARFFWKPIVSYIAKKRIFTQSVVYKKCLNRMNVNRFFYFGKQAYLQRYIVSYPYFLHSYKIKKLGWAIARPSLCLYY